MAFLGTKFPKGLTLVRQITAQLRTPLQKQSRAGSFTRLPGLFWQTLGRPIYALKYGPIFFSILFKKAIYYTYDCTVARF